MKQRKFYIPDCAWDLGALQDWLEHLSRRGWRFQKQKGGKACFEKIAPDHCRIRLEPLEEAESTQRREERSTLYAEMGWQDLGTLETYRVYTCPDPAAAELHTDPVAANWARRKMLDQAWDRTMEGWKVLFWLAVVMAFFRLTGFATVESVVCGDFSAVYGLAALAVPVLLVKSIADTLRLRRARKELEAEVPLDSGNWRWGRSVTLAAVAFSLILNGAWLGEGLWQIFRFEEGNSLSAIEYPLPYIPGEELYPELTGVEQTLDLFSSHASVLAPQQYRMMEGWADDRDLFTRVCQVRFSPLAGPLYEEWLDGTLREHPEASVETLADASFDRAVLCTYGNRQTMYLRQGSYVLEVYARELPSLGDHLDAYDALLSGF